jgi:hypothetical protein
MTIALVLLASTAFGATFVETGSGTTDSGGSQDWFTNSGMVWDAGSNPGDGISTDSSGTGWAHEFNDGDDVDDIFFEALDTFDFAFTSHHGYIKLTQIGVGDVHYSLAGVTQVGPVPNPGDDGGLTGLPAGEYQFRILCWNNSGYNNTWGTWTVALDFADPPAPPVAEPAGLGLVGMALLGLRKRRS